MSYTSRHLKIHTHKNIYVNMWSHTCVYIYECQNVDIFTRDVYKDRTGKMTINKYIFDKTLWRICRAVLQIYRNLSRIYRALLWIYRAFLQIYRALLQIYRALLQIYRALWHTISEITVNRYIMDTALWRIYKALLKIRRALWNTISKMKHQ